MGRGWTVGCSLGTRLPAVPWRRGFGDVVRLDAEGRVRPEGVSNYPDFWHCDPNFRCRRAMALTAFAVSPLSCSSVFTIGQRRVQQTPVEQSSRRVGRTRFCRMGRSGIFLLDCKCPETSFERGVLVFTLRYSACVNILAQRHCGRTLARAKPSKRFNSAQSISVLEFLRELIESMVVRLRWDSFFVVRSRAHVAAS